MRALVTGLSLFALAACTQTPSGPTFNVDGNSGPVTINAPVGDGNAVGTAPCGASSQNKPATAGTAPTGVNPNCTTKTTTTSTNTDIAPAP